MNKNHEFPTVREKKKIVKMQKISVILTCVALFGQFGQDQFCKTLSLELLKMYLGVSVGIKVWALSNPPFIRVNDFYDNF